MRPWFQLRRGCRLQLPPEASAGGAAGLIKEGDTIIIDARKRLLQLEVDDDVLARRRAADKPKPPDATRGVLAKYARLVGTASKGAVTDQPD